MSPPFLLSEPVEPVKYQIMGPVSTGMAISVTAKAK